MEEKEKESSTFMQNVINEKIHKRQLKVIYFLIIIIFLFLLLVIAILLSKNKKLNKELIENEKYNIYCNGMTFNHTILLASTLYSINNETIVYVCDNAFHANQAYDTFCDILGYEHVNLYAIDDFMATEAIVISNELKQERLITLKNIIENNNKVIVTHVSAITKPIISKEKFIKNIININPASTLISIILFFTTILQRE